MASVNLGFKASLKCGFKEAIEELDVLASKISVFFFAEI